MRVTKLGFFLRLSGVQSSDYKIIYSCSTLGASIFFSICCLPPSSRETVGFPGGSEVKVPASNAGNLGSIPGSGRSPREGNGNPLQYSCLENPMDGGAWWATVHGVTKSRTRLSDFTFTFTFSYDPIECSPPGSSVHGILQARILEQVAISSSKRSS